MFARGEVLRSLSDTQTRHEFQRLFTQHYPNVHSSTVIHRVDYDQHRKVFTIRYRHKNGHDHSILEVDQLLVATGKVYACMYVCMCMR
jgi:cation diffusion facilitator CzcD-associated flavoprotein CzcO